MGWEAWRHQSVERVMGMCPFVGTDVEAQPLVLLGAEPLQGALHQAMGQPQVCSVTREVPPVR